MNGLASVAGDVALGLVLCSLSGVAVGILRYVIRTIREMKEARRRIHAVRDRVREPLRAPGNRIENSFITERTKNDG